MKGVTYSKDLLAKMVKDGVLDLGRCDQVTNLEEL